VARDDGTQNRCEAAADEQRIVEQHDRSVCATIK
jgi:hypothetical protein